MSFYYKTEKISAEGVSIGLRFFFFNFSYIFQLNYITRNYVNSEEISTIYSEIKTSLSILLIFVYF